MKANARARTAPRTGGESAVSSVVSAVLVFSLFSTAFVMWSVTQYPGWVEDRETNHQAAVRQALAQAQGDLERLSASEQTGPVTATLPLAARPIPLFGGVPSSGRLHLEDGVSFDATFTAPRLHVAGGGVAGTPTAGPQTVTGIHGLHHLHLGLDSASVTAKEDQAWVQATLFDDDTTFTARLIHGGSSVVAECSGRGIVVRVSTDAGTRDTVVLCESGAALAGFTVDLLDPRFGLAGRLGDLSAGHSLTVSEGQGGGGGVSATGRFLATWSDEDGNTRVAGSGTSTPGFGVLREGARLVFEPSRSEATPESLAWEHGAVVAQQDGAAGITVEPDLALAVDGSTGYLRWTVTRLSGTGDMTGGSGTLQVTHESTSDVVLSATGAGITLTTPSAAAWRSHLSALVQSTGTTDATVSGTGDEARLELASGTVTEWVLHLRVVDARASLR